jgi:hypothetical protein
VSRSSPTSSASARSSSSAAHSSSKKSSWVSMCVDRSCAFAISAPFSGDAVSVENRSAA